MDEEDLLPISTTFIQFADDSPSHQKRIDSWLSRAPFQADQNKTTFEVCTTVHQTIRYRKMRKIGGMANLA
jgi:hypothetical protein